MFFFFLIVGLVAAVPPPICDKGFSCVQCVRAKGCIFATIDENSFCIEESQLEFVEFNILYQTEKRCGQGMKHFNFQKDQVANTPTFSPVTLVPLVSTTSMVPTTASVIFQTTTTVTPSSTFVVSQTTPTATSAPTVLITSSTEYKSNTFSDPAFSQLIQEHEDNVTMAALFMESTPPNSLAVDMTTSSSLVVEADLLVQTEKVAMCKETVMTLFVRSLCRSKQLSQKIDKKYSDFDDGLLPQFNKNVCNFLVHKRAACKNEL